MAVMPCAGALGTGGLALGCRGCVSKQACQRLLSSGRAGFGCVTTTLHDSLTVRLESEICPIAERMGQQLVSIDGGFVEFTRRAARAGNPDPGLSNREGKFGSGSSQAALSAPAGVPGGRLQLSPPLPAQLRLRVRQDSMQSALRMSSPRERFQTGK